MYLTIHKAQISLKVEGKWWIFDYENIIVIQHLDALSTCCFPYLQLRFFLSESSRQSVWNPWILYTLVPTNILSSVQEYLLLHHLWIKKETCTIIKNRVHIPPSFKGQWRSVIVGVLLYLRSRLRSPLLSLSSCSDWKSLII